VRILGFWLKALSALPAVLASYGFGIGIENGTILDDFLGNGYVLAFAGGLLAAGNHFRPREPIMDAAGRSGIRRLQPGRKQQQWLPREVWLEFPDPLPDVPDMTGSPETDIPEGEVPPDENLRRLWLVRAQLTAHLDTATAKVRKKKFPAPGGVAVAAIGLALCALTLLAGAEPPGEEQTLLGRLLATAVAMALFGFNLIAYTEGFSLAAKRRKALHEEEARLMTLDATRPGGPIGGPAVQAGEIPYVPPSLEAYRLN
jgi:hypothetical protein